MPPVEENWRNELNDETKANPAISNFTGIQQMVDSFIEMKSYQGQSIHIPNAEAGDDAKAAFVQSLMDKAPNLMLKPDFDNAEQSAEFYATFGRPSASNEYDSPDVEFPEGMKPNEGKVEAMRELAFDMGLNKSQFKTFVKSMTESDIAESLAENNHQNDEMTALNKEWGQATKERISAALSIAERTKAPETVVDLIKNNKMSSEMMKWVYSLSVSIGDEGNQLGDLPHNQTGKMTPGEAQEAIDAMYANKEHAFHKGETRAMQRMIELVGIANPDSSKSIDSIRA